MAQANDPGEHGTREPLRAPLAYTAEQGAGIIGGSCKASWLKKLAREKKIPHLKIGGAYNFTDRHILAIISYFEQPVPAVQPQRGVPAGRPSTLQDGALPPVPAAGAVQFRDRTPRRRVRAPEQVTHAHKDDEGGQASVAW